MLLGQQLREMGLYVNNGENILGPRLEERATGGGGCARIFLPGHASCEAFFDIFDVLIFDISYGFKKS
jgi:hypothetical protein